MSTHAPTPGPWTAKRSRHGGYSVECRGRLTNPSSTAVCSVRAYPRTPEAHAEAEATARLIAEAPAMRETLEEACTYIARDLEGDEGESWGATILAKARAVLSKAEGAT